MKIKEEEKKLVFMIDKFNTYELLVPLITELRRKGVLYKKGGCFRSGYQIDILKDTITKWCPLNNQRICMLIAREINTQKEERIVKEPQSWSHYEYIYRIILTLEKQYIEKLEEMKKPFIEDPEKLGFPDSYETEIFCGLYYDIVGCAPSLKSEPLTIEELAEKLGCGVIKELLKEALFNLEHKGWLTVRRPNPQWVKSGFVENIEKIILNVKDIIMFAHHYKS